MRTFVSAVFVLALLACGEPADNPIPQTQAPEVQTFKVEPSEEAAKPSKQDEAPPADQTAEPSKVEEVEPAESTQPDEPELVTTTFPPLGMHFSVPPYHGPATMERRIADADIIAIVSLASTATAVETYTDEGHTGYVGALKFTFNVEELIKSPAGSSPSQIVAMVGSLQGYAERSDAQAVADKMARERDTQWDDRQAIVFLATHSLKFPGSLSDDLHFISYVDYTYGLGDRYSIASIRNQLWLPEASTSRGSGGANTARTPQERRFLTGVPQQTPDTSPRAATVSTQTETPSITLADFKSSVSGIEAELAGQSVGYRRCVRANYYRLQREAILAASGRSYPVFPILGVFRLNGQPKRDDGMIFGSCKARQSPVYPIRDAFLAVNHASCPSLSSSGPRQWGESALKTSRLPGALSLLAKSWLYPPSAWRRR